jgi:hypothetical protein
MSTGISTIRIPCKVQQQEDVDVGKVVGEGVGTATGSRRAG